MGNTATFSFIFKTTKDWKKIRVDPSVKYALDNCSDVGAALGSKTDGHHKCQQLENTLNKKIV